jgi:hypothetical protein
MRNVIGPAVSLAIVSCLAGAAHADVVPPETSACTGKQAGDSCSVFGSDSGAGTCLDATCTRLDYSRWDRDASGGPPSTSYACLKCTPTTTSSTQTSTATWTQSGTMTVTVVGTDTGTDPGPPPAGDDGSCSLGRGTAARRIAPWLMAASFSLLFLLSRRRRR